jgi:hypothetical protein
LIAKLTGSDGGIFGSSRALAISNNRIVVGASGYQDDRGVAYVFGDPTNPQSGRKYEELAILTISDGQTDDAFGWSVAIDGDSIVIGAKGELVGTGAVYVFRIIEDENNNIISVTQMAKLTASSGAAGDQFG